MPTTVSQRKLQTSTHSAYLRLVLYLMLAVVLRLVLFVYFPAMLTQDSSDYVRAALDIHARLDFNSRWLGDVRMPGYPIFLAAIYPVTGTRSDLLVLVQTALGLACVPLAWKLGRLLHAQAVADALALFFAFNPVYLLLEHTLMTELLSIFLMVVFTLVIVVCLHKPPSPWLSFFVAVLLGVGMLVRVNLAPYGVTLAAIAIGRWLWGAWRAPGGARFGTMLAVTLLPALGLLLTLGPWLWRNYAAYHNISLSEHSARTLLMWKTMSGTMDSSLPLYQRYSYGLGQMSYEWLNEVNTRYATVQAEAIANSVVAEQIRVHPERQFEAIFATALNYTGIFREGSVPSDDRAAIAWWFRNWVPNPAAIGPGLAHMRIKEWLEYVPITQTSVWTQMWGLSGKIYLAIVRPLLLAAMLITSLAFVLRARLGEFSVSSYPQRAVASLILAYYATAIFHFVTLTGSDRFIVISDWVAVLVSVFVISQRPSVPAPILPQPPIG